MSRTDKQSHYGCRFAHLPSNPASLKLRPETVARIQRSKRHSDTGLAACPVLGGSHHDCWIVA
jgi:hypothetical protein